MYEQLITLLIGTLLGGFIKHLFEVRKTGFERESLAMAELQKDRWLEYEKLWNYSGLLPKWPRNTQLTLGQLHALSYDLKNWYFGKGGIMMSKESREAYEFVQIALTKAWEGVQNEQSVVSAVDYDAIRSAFSNLRSEMTQDLKSRKRQIIL